LRPPNWVVNFSKTLANFAEVFANFAKALVNFAKALVNFAEAFANFAKTVINFSKTLASFAEVFANFFGSQRSLCRLSHKSQLSLSSEEAVLHPEMPGQCSPQPHWEGKLLACNKWKVAPASLFLCGEFVFGGVLTLLGCLCVCHPRVRMVWLAPQFSDVLLLLDVVPAAMVCH
jgi:hypothetical protein